MTARLTVHPTHPQARLLQQISAGLFKGDVVALPTDTAYALVCALDDKNAVARLRRLRGIDDKHHLSLLCPDLSALATLARVNNPQYRLLNAATPGAFTFILDASKEVPRRVSHPSRKTIGLRVPSHPVPQALLALHGQAVEVVTSAHTGADAARYADLATEFGLLASTGSDFHSPTESRCDLGSMPPLPGQVTPVWEALQHRVH